MRVAILSSEVVPFAKTGGLADVAGALPKALCEHDVDAHVVLPLYDQIDRDLLNDEVIEDVPLNGAAGIRHYRVLQSNAAGAPAYLIEAPEYFRVAQYTAYGDDHERFAFFSRAALAFFKHLNWQPDIVHSNDWPCGFAVASNFAHAVGTTSSFIQHERCSRFITLRTRVRLIQRISGGWVSATLPSSEDFMLKGAASALKAGLVASDALSTVSRRYAQEIQTPDQGYGLDWILRARRDRFVGSHKWSGLRSLESGNGRTHCSELFG